jgi:probable H4MPT-linked C1 transfer pathway protein
VKVLGLDIGGANLKAAHSDAEAWSVPFALWKDPDALSEQLQSLASASPAFDRIGLTMTAELCDCFETKRQGVHHVLDAVAAAFGDRPVEVWTTEGKFIQVDQARANPLSCAAANWYALATDLARTFATGSVLMIDIGSTTSDLVALYDGQPQAQGSTDMDRLRTGELVYIGVRRTPVAALATHVQMKGQKYRIMAEQFATTADVFLLTGHLQEQEDCCDSADGRPLTRPYAAARLARSIGADMEMIFFDDAQDLAFSYCESLLLTLCDAVVQVQLPARIGAGVPFERAILSGSGEFLSDMLAEVLQMPVVKLSQEIGASASDCACASAVVKLLESR